MSPNPPMHALHADKRNLVALSDTMLLVFWGVSEVDRAGGAPDRTSHA